MPPYVLVLISLTAFRIHSIFVLRLFNDPVAMLLFYAACAFFVNHKWTVGCALFRCVCSSWRNHTCMHRERERQKDRESDRDRERETERERQRERETERETERERETRGRTRRHSAPWYS